jgi:hypothetical protein
MVYSFSIGISPHPLIRSILSSLAVAYYEKEGDLFSKTNLMKPKMHSLSYVFALSMCSVVLSSYYRFLKIPFWAYVIAFGVYEAGRVRKGLIKRGIQEK